MGRRRPAAKDGVADDSDDREQPSRVESTRSDPNPNPIDCSRAPLSLQMSSAADAPHLIGT